MLLAGVERQTGLIDHLADVIRNRRHPSYFYYTHTHTHTLSDLLRQRIYPLACDYLDVNDANRLRHDPMFKLALGQAPLHRRQ